jgi:two-component system response regulator HydG
MASILIADDDDTYRESIQRVLEREGHHVEAAPDVDSALRALHGGRFDLIVCDYRMPGKSGIDLMQQLRREKSTVPVLMISACADSGTEARAMELGAVELLKKPVKRQVLIERAARFAGG